MQKIYLFSVILLIFLISSCTSNKKDRPVKLIEKAMIQKEVLNSNLDFIILGGGCFWCVEGAYERLKGIKKVVSGYAGGKVKNPSYEAVCSGVTGHAEVVKIIFDPTIISLQEILDVFWTVHDPTTLNRQGNDVGTQYRSIILYANTEQKSQVQQAIAQLKDSKKFTNPIVTQVVPLTVFYSAEKYHQDYYDNNKSQPYCLYVVKPKIEKVEKLYKTKLKAKYRDKNK